MTELVRISAFRRGDGEEGSTTFEQEAFIPASSEFSADIVAGGVEATLNRLVSATDSSHHSFDFFFLVLNFYFVVELKM